MDQLNEQLHRLLGNTHIDFTKRKKILLQLERKHNQYRRSTERTDFDNQKKLTANTDLIHRIKKTIIYDDHQQRQRRRMQQQQAENNHWSSGHMTMLGGAVLVGILCVVTFMIMTLANYKEKYI